MINIVYIDLFFEWCRLLGEFILPPSNILPRTYREISLIMK
jgi:hypothetical protein